MVAEGTALETCQLLVALVVVNVCVQIACARYYRRQKHASRVSFERLEQAHGCASSVWKQSRSVVRAAVSQVSDFDQAPPLIPDFA